MSAAIPPTAGRSADGNGGGGAIARPDHRLIVLDGWRGVFALLVAVFHFTVASHLFEMTLVRSAWMFVDFFFVLSGLVIHHVYAGRLHTTGDVTRFVIRRFGRVWPLHAAMLGVLVVFELVKALLLSHGLGHADRAAFTGQTSLSALCANLALVQAMGLFPMTTWNTPGWSISVEFFTYLIFAGLVLAVSRRFGAVAGALVVASALFLWIVPVGHLHVMTDFGIVRCVYGFMLGCLVSRIVARGGLAWAGGSIAEVLVLILSTLILYAGMTRWSVLAPPVFAAAVLVFARERGIVSGLLAMRPFQVLGRLSYSIYMVHAPIMLIGYDRVARMLAGRLGGGPVPYRDVNGETFPLLTFPSLWMGDLVLLGFIMTVLVASMITCRFIEQPAQRWFNRRAAVIARPEGFAAPQARL